MLLENLVVSQRWLRQLWKRDDGQDLIEYALMAGFVAVAVALIFPTSIAPTVNSIMTKVANVLQSAPN